MFEDVYSEVEGLENDLKEIEELDDDLIQIDELLNDSNIPTFQETPLDHIKEREEEVSKRIPGNEENLYEIIYQLGNSLSKKLRSMRGVYLLNSSMGHWKNKEVDDDGKVKRGKLNWIFKLGSIRNHVVATIDVDLEIEDYRLKDIRTFKNIRGESFPFTRKDIVSQFSC